MERVLPYTIKGASGELTFTGDVVQIRRTGLFGALRQWSGEGRGNKDIHLSAIAAIRVEPGSFSYKPFIQIIHSGSKQEQGGGGDVLNDDNTVFFKKADVAEFEAFRDLVMSAKAGQKLVAVTASDSAVDQIKKLADLHAAGVLTDDEFSKKKQDLLARI